jgi:ArsR family transcriptional regulator
MFYNQLFSALNHTLRFDMIMLVRQRELCICELESILDTKQYQISRHMKILRDLNLVLIRKQEKYHYYSLNEESEFFIQMLDFIDHHPDQRVNELNKALEELSDKQIVCER